MATIIQLFDEIAHFDVGKRRWKSSDRATEQILEVNLGDIRPREYVPDWGFYAAKKAEKDLGATIIQIDPQDQEEPKRRKGSPPLIY